MARVPKRPFLQRFFQRTPLKTTAIPAPRKVWTPPTKPVVTPKLRLVVPKTPEIITPPPPKPAMPAAPMTATDEAWADNEAWDYDAGHDPEVETDEDNEPYDYYEDYMAKAKPKHGAAIRRKWREQYQRRKARDAEREQEEGKMPEPKKRKSNGAAAPELHIVETPAVELPPVPPALLETVEQPVTAEPPTVFPEPAVTPLELPKDHNFKLASMPIVEPAKGFVKELGEELDAMERKAEEHKPEVDKLNMASTTLVIGLVTLAVGAGAAGGYNVVQGVLEPAYGFIPSVLRAATPFGLEMVAGLAAHWLIMHRSHLPGLVRSLLTVIAITVTLGCAAVEIDAASEAPAIAMRAQKEKLMDGESKRLQTTIQTPAEAQNVGKKGAYQAQLNAGAMLDMQKANGQQAADLFKQRMANAADRTSGEGRLPIEMSILGALAASCFLPLLQTFLDNFFGLFRRRKEKTNA